VEVQEEENYKGQEKDIELKLKKTIRRNRRKSTMI